MRRFSASALATAQDCLRKWGFKYIEGIETPPHPSAAFGSEFHDRRARWLSGQEVPDIERVGLEDLPQPGTPGLLIEQAFDILIRGRWFTGRKDFEVPGVVGDHKTCKNFRYAKTPDDLRDDFQACLYAAETMVRTGTDHCDLHWIYYCTSKPQSRPVQVRITRDEVSPTLERMVALADTLTALEEAGARALDLPPNLDACDSYGGCPYQSICPREVFPMTITPAEVIAKMKSKGINPPPMPPPAPVLAIRPPPPPPRPLPKAPPPPPPEDDAKGNVKIQSMSLKPSTEALTKSEFLMLALYHEDLGRYFRSKL